MRRTPKIVLALAAFLMLTACRTSSIPGEINPDDYVFRVNKTWDRTGIRNHYHGGSNIGPIEWLSVEPLVQYVRSTDELHYLLAEEIIHNDDHTSLIKVRQNAKWHTGEDFTAEDVIAFFHINFVSVTNYIAKPLEEVDNKTVKITWKTWMEPNANVKNLLLAETKVGSVQYSTFKSVVDRCQEILRSQERAPEGYNDWAPFGYINSKASETLYMENYNTFRAMNPKTFVATGPFKVERVTQNQMVLVRNKDYYFADNIKFGTVLGYNTPDINGIYNLLSTDKIDYQDGLAPEATLNSILTQNPKLTHLKMFDPGAIGLVFNLEKEIWAPKVREAFQYLFNREEMKNAGNKYGITSNFPLVGMAPSEAKAWMKESDYNRIPTYTFDQNRAAQLLNEAGWTKSGGKWMVGGVPVKLSLGYDGSHPGMSGVAEGVSSTLNTFGIELVLKRAADFGTWFDTAKTQESVYDFVVNWTDLNMSFSYPTGSFNYVLNDINGPIMHLQYFTQEDYENGIIDDERLIGKPKLTLPKADGSGETFRISEYLPTMYSLTEEELHARLADMVLGLASQNFGLSFYQNVTGSFLNKDLIATLPLQEHIAQNRNVTYVPEVGSDDFYAVARTNLWFSQGIVFSKGYYEPRP
ncbi:MAG: Nickel-binding periplasmic protein precursor [Tenericutes bacterium ADurb.Bin239]|nr:ABC transporter substrate-binding protein [Bacillota bacterium]OQA79055.1 MAG: Nickel-binding periplasmic protein precursor [Tenericutes bacterium ADurb.Bin239]